MDSETLKLAPLNTETNTERAVFYFTKKREAMEKETWKLRT